MTLVHRIFRRRHTRIKPMLRVPLTMRLTAAMLNQARPGPKRWRGLA